MLHLYGNGAQLLPNFFVFVYIYTYILGRDQVLLPLAQRTTCQDEFIKVLNVHSSDVTMSSMFTKAFLFSAADLYYIEEYTAYLCVCTGILVLI